MPITPSAARRRYLNTWLVLDDCQILAIRATRTHCQESERKYWPLITETFEKKVPVV
jgi:hypothetical protein